MHRQRIAVLMTVHNRRQTTLACLYALFVQTGLDTDFEVRVFLVNDGSTDGTGEAVRRRFPEVTVIPGNGELFWAAGMARAEQAAATIRPDAFLWLNDDVCLFDDALARLLEVLGAHQDAIVVGATRASDAERITYGGRTRAGAHPMRLEPLREPEALLRCDTFEGNVVLVPSVVREAVGEIDGTYPHAFADTDYGLRAGAAGFDIMQARGYVGTCDDRPGRRHASAPRQAWREVNCPKGLPWRAQMKFLRRHGDWRWPWWLVGGQVKQVAARTGMPRS